ncbi:ATPase type 13A2 [Monoraphidium neglectum]|uniref:ATPase type 13A2 n=1 Tax=Monoraphidium neglectum TaxID=145388 RepID=A0A0D2LSL6_9CHLO|nr:ATPase type 13A2 [Monoraphidium neglectum]KIY92781.1 ATPase type 13A2 [Monoraphidium neglectum]|eukprot:XP_013891801.1 ATPase type 13A2 [Monoraphidium neglectum]
MAALPPGLPQLLASCHGLARMGETLVGDPLDQKLFAASEWDLHDHDEATTHSAAAADAIAAAMQQQQQQQQQQDGGAAVAAAGPAPPALGWVCPPGAAGAVGGFDPSAAAAIVRRFEFSSALQRNLVVVRRPAAVGGGYALYAKGSPEMIRTLVEPGSVPEDFDRVLGEYTREGLRVLALAGGDASGLPPAALSSSNQQQLEAAVPLRLLGLAVLANPLRPDTAGVIEVLQKAQIRCGMVTGDHLRTAISVALQCGVLPAARPVLLVDGEGGGGGLSRATAGPQPRPSLTTCTFL